MSKPYTTLADIKRALDAMEAVGNYDLENIPVLIGDDDEMNGIHTAWNRQGFISRHELEELEKDCFVNVSTPRKTKEDKKTDMFYLIY